MKAAMKAATAPKAKKKDKSAPVNVVGSKILVNVVLDRSGSMESIRAGTIDGYNEYINGLKDDKKTEYSVSLTQFDAHGQVAGPELTVCYIDTPLAEVPKLGLDTYQPRGGTPLYDAIGETIRRTESIVNGRPVLCIIITDGMENASKEFDQEAVKRLIKSKEDLGWTFVFLGANIDSYAVAHGIGGQAMASNAANYAPQQVRYTFGVMGQSTMNYASARQNTRSVSQVAGEQFFTESDRAAMVSGSAGLKTSPNPFNAGNTGKKQPWSVVDQDETKT